MAWMTLYGERVEFNGICKGLAGCKGVAYPPVFQTLQYSIPLNPGLAASVLGKPINSRPVRPTDKPIPRHISHHSRPHICEGTYETRFGSPLSYDAPLD